MEYETFGESGLVVSRIAFGAMTFGEGELVPGVTNRISQAMADAMVGRALDAGVNLFDTADAYTGGQSEVMLGKALGPRRPDVVVATKCGFRSGDAIGAAGLSRRHVVASVEGSLRRLGTDYIDLYFLHIPDPITPYEETVAALDEVVARGLVRYAGFSNFPAWQAAMMLGLQERRGDARFVGGQMYYSLLGRDAEHEIVPFFRQAGLGLMVWSPLASGFLTGKYTRENPAPENARRSKFALPPVDVEKGYEVVDALKLMADARGATVAQVALAWVLAKPFVSTVLVGASTPEQLDANLAAGDVRLTPEEVAELDALTAAPAPYPGWMVPLGHDAKLAEGMRRK
jgi:aryl-alcohol dehydrogenase-like predicted oxidoreductase